jgi:hyperosmotically inducible periplasmic protein
VQKGASVKLVYLLPLVVASCCTSSNSLFAQANSQPAANTGRTQPPEDAQRLALRIQKEILGLREYSLFDDIRFSVRNYQVTLRGAASRPITKSTIENVVKKLEGVEKVVNEIEVLPPGSMDDDIRVRTYIAVYGHPALARYNPNRGVPVLGTLAQRAGGITNDPPLGWHPIHIIVKNGNVRLEGVVQNAGDSAIAFVQANGVPGTFVVENNLQIAQTAKPKKMKK